MNSAILNSIGLSLVLLGAFILWLITPVYSGGTAYWSSSEAQAEIDQVAKRRERKARWGFGLICLGTLVQIVVLWPGTLLALKRWLCWILHAH